MLLLGLDIGSSSVKASLFDAEKGVCIHAAQSPRDELAILSPRDGWAEQDPETWFLHVEKVVASLRKSFAGSLEDIGAIGIAYQMHGLVAVDKQGQPVRNSIIWCDSRAISIGDRAFNALGEDYCQGNLLNSPGNFTASKLKWVMDNEPKTYEKIHKVMLPGDYIAYRLTGDMVTTASGLSEGIFWDFKNNDLSQKLLNHYGIDRSLIPDLVPTLGLQGTLSGSAAENLGLKKGTPVTYRAGDQPNNALSLNVMQAGEVAATAGTSGVVYGVATRQKPDPQSRVNTFLHVSHKTEKPKLGILLCINGTGILNTWLKRNVMSQDLSYEHMNKLAETIQPGSDGLLVFPFGNGAERVLGNSNPGARIIGLDLNRHSNAHLLRASQEGIVYAMAYGIEVMQELGLSLNSIRAARANMFLSRTFRNTFANLSNTPLEIYDTDGAQGAARGAGIGAGIYKSEKEAFDSLALITRVVPEKLAALQESYARWKIHLQKLMAE